MAEIVGRLPQLEEQAGSGFLNIFRSQNSYTKMTITTLVLFLIASPLMLFGGFNGSATLATHANANKTTSISFTPTDKLVKAGDTFNLDITVDPGNNATVIDNIFLKINYDKAYVAPTKDCLVAVGPLDTSEQANCTDSFASLNMTASPGQSTHLLSSKRVVARLTLTARQTVNPTKTFILFDPLTSATTVSAQESGLNNIGSFNPATVNIFPVTAQPTEPQVTSGNCTTVKVCPSCTPGQECLQVCYTKKVCN